MIKKVLKHPLFLPLLAVIALAGFAPVLSQSATAIICRFEAVPCVAVWNSNDIIMYRDQGGTETIRVDGQGSIRVAVPTQVGTATPGLVIQAGANSNPLEVRNSSGTPVWSVSSGGSASSSGGGTNNSNLVISVPTAIGTATPGLYINSLGVSNSFQIDKAGTPQMQISNSGVVSPALVVAAPTGIGTATPVLMANTAGGLSNLLELRKNSTPVFTVGQAGAITGQVLGSSTSGQRVTCGVQSITAAATVVHGLSTPTALISCVLAADPTGNQTCTYTNSAGVVTVKLWQSPAGTPTANGAATSTSWCVIGTP